ncbi:uncharacterized protein LOC128982569 [Macrosteles quadrilineatus]|uniref:uncharacterized protein LOC128982569 n=1 Tax=Macrosteles quadrilineatus TaxID=74068 RepID=UPI0023E33A7F|nr:uncharacterized protein LOC128982569 [Macrosteles quadrilineatus]
MAQAQSSQLSLYVKQLLHLLGSLETILNSDPQGNKLETERSLAPVPTKSCQLPSSDRIPLPKPFDSWVSPPDGEWIINHTGHAVLVPFLKSPLYGTWFMNSSGNPEFLPDGRQLLPLPQGGKWTISSSGRPEWVVTQNPTITTEEQTTPPPGEWIINHTGYAILVPFQKMRLFGTWFMNTSGKPEFLPDGKIFPSLPQGGKWTISSSGRPEWVVTQNPTCTTEEQTTPPPGEWTINHTGYAILVPFQKMRLFGTWFMNTSGKPEFLPDGKIFPSLPQGGKWTISSSGRPEWVVTQNPTCTTEKQTTPPPGEWTINHTGYAILVPFQKMRLFGTWFMNTSGKPEFLPDGKIFPSLPQGGKWTISSSGRPEWVVTQNPTCTTEEQTTPPPGEWTINHTGYAILVPFQKMRLFGTWFMNTSGKPEFIPDGKIFPSLPQGGKWTISSSGRPEWVVTQNPTITTEEQTTPPPGEWTINHTGYAILVPFQKMRLFGHGL